MAPTATAQSTPTVPATLDAPARDRLPIEISEGYLGVPLPGLPDDAPEAVTAAWAAYQEARSPLTDDDPDAASERLRIAVKAWAAELRANYGAVVAGQTERVADRVAHVLAGIDALRDLFAELGDEAQLLEAVLRFNGAAASWHYTPRRGDDAALRERADAPPPAQIAGVVARRPVDPNPYALTAALRRLALGAIPAGPESPLRELGHALRDDLERGENVAAAVSELFGGRRA